MDKTSLFIVILLAILAGAALIAFAIKYNILTFKAPEEKPAPKTAALRVALIQKYAEKAIAGATVKLYDLSKKFLDSRTTNTDGVATTVVPVTEGTTYILFISADNGTVYEIQVTPLASDYDETTKTFTKVIEFPIMPLSVDMVVLDPNYAQLANGGVINLTDLGKTTFSIQVIVKNPNLNTGFLKFSSTILGYELEPAIVIRVTGKATITSGATKFYTYGTYDEAYLIELEPGVLDTYKDVTGEYTKSITFDASALGTGESVTVTIYVYGQFSPTYFKEHSGQLNPEAKELATITFTIIKG